MAACGWHSRASGSSTLRWQDAPVLCGMAGAMEGKGGSLEEVTLRQVLRVERREGGKAQMTAAMPSSAQGARRPPSRGAWAAAAVGAEGTLGRGTRSVFEAPSGSDPQVRFGVDRTGPWRCLVQGKAPKELAQPLGLLLPAGPLPQGTQRPRLAAQLSAFRRRWEEECGI